MVQAESMDLETHDMLIQKLEAGKSQGPQTTLSLRLADLYSDRARLRFVKENEKSCNSCLGSLDDRKKALTLYNSIFETLDPDQKERAFVQISQSYNLLKRKNQAVRFHKKIITGKYHKKLKALAYLAEAERYFFAQEYKLSLSHYKKAKINNSNLANAMTDYRMAWCEFNTGSYQVAKLNLVRILQSTYQIDTQLKSDMARDLAKFTAKVEINQQSLRLVHSLSPAGEEKANVEILATELDRLGRHQENLTANRYILENFKIENIDSAFAYLRMSQAEQTLKMTTKTKSTFSLSGHFFKKVDCKNEYYQKRCQEYEKKSKKFLVYWNRVEKDKPSQNLLNVWQEYLKVFPEDFDMHYIAGQSFHKAKIYQLSVQYFLQTALILKNKDLVNKNKKIFEESLNASMGVAEESNLNSLKKMTYLKYLEINPKGSKFLQAKYQLAYLDYEAKETDLALQKFKEVIKIGTVVDKSKTNYVIAKKSADLILDIYASQKDNKKIMEYAKVYAVAFPGSRQDFLTVYRKALLHEGVMLLGVNEKVSYKKEILAKMKKLSFRSVPEKEQILLLETQVRLAKDLQDLKEMIRSSKKILTYKKVNRAKTLFAYENLIWAHKVSLSFSQAFYFKKKESKANKKNKTELVELALLAELSGQNPKSYYEQFLKNSHGTLEGNRIRAKIVQSSHVPWSEIKSRIDKMKKSPLLLSELTLETFARYKNTKAAEMVLSHNSVANKPAGKILRRHLEIPKFNKTKNKLVAHKLRTRSSSQMQADIAKRVELISQMEAIANSAIDRKDFVLQISALTVLEKEKNRLAKELKVLPIPKGLNATETKQYQSILKNKIDSMIAESIEIARTIDKSWSNEEFIAEKEKQKEESPLVIQSLIAEEAKFLLMYAPSSKKSSLVKLAQVSNAPIKDLGAARREVKINPFSIENIAKLKKIEFLNNNLSHVAFLDSRLSELSKKVMP